MPFAKQPMALARRVAIKILGFDAPRRRRNGTSLARAEESIMYVPKAFQEDRLPVLHQAIRQAGLATLVTVGPDNTIPIGFSIGTWNNTTETCQTVISNDLALQGRIIIGTAQSSGAFCVRVYDVGRLTAPSTYVLQVSHP
jgi:hypothetical protein